MVDPASSALPITVFIADDHEAVRGALRELLEAQPDMRVVGVAGDGAAALSGVRRLHPGVAVVDVAMPLLDGIELTRQITENEPLTRVIIYSIHCSCEHVARARAAGALGYLPKEADGRELIAAVRAVHAGGTHYSALLPGLG